MCIATVAIKEMGLYMLFMLFVVPVIETFKLHIKRCEYLLWYNFTDSKNEADKKQFIDNNNNDKNHIQILFCSWSQNSIVFLP